MRGRCREEADSPGGAMRYALLISEDENVVINAEGQTARARSV
jgi:hypothetical protein